MSSVMRLLKIEHNRMRKLFAILQEQLSRIESGERGDFDIIDAVFSYCESYAERCHHPKENIVYRQLLASGGDADGVVGDLLREHAALGATGKKAADPVGGLREDAVAASVWAKTEAAEFLRFNLSHLDREEETFFPLVEQTMSDDDWAEIDRQIAASGNPDFGADTAKRFEYLLDYIANLDRLNDVSRAG